jgi:hypothetical protein
LNQQTDSGATGKAGGESEHGIVEGVGIMEGMQRTVKRYAGVPGIK